jgi:alkenylglycerophosphocholine hydrolase
LINGWFFLALIFIGMNWLAVWFNWKSANFISKPSIIISLLGWLFSTTYLDVPAAWFSMGLAFALAGDTLLMFKGKSFLFGMIAFMLMHAMYIIGFNQSAFDINPTIIILSLASITIWIILFSSLRNSALLNPEYRQLEIPLIGYNIIILMMVISSLMTNFRSDWSPAASVLVSCGALLFFFSDVLLAVDRFINPMPTARLWKRVTYQLGQLAIISGIVLTFSA